MTYISENNNRVIEYLIESVGLPVNQMALVERVVIIIGIKTIQQMYIRMRQGENHEPPQ
jgi:hypothetical protein